VYFLAGGVLADNEDALGNTAVEGDHNLYVWRRDAAHPEGQTKFIARLLSSEVQIQQSENGRYMVLVTATPVVPTDTDNSRDVFRYDADTGQLIRVSVNTSGIGGNDDNRDASIAQASPAHPPEAHHINTAITKNGEMIAFSTPEQLSRQDGNELSDVYLWSSGKVYMITSGGLNGGGREARLTGSGRDLFFQTPEALTQADPDLAVDVYDARIDGGFPFKPAPTCTGEGCLGAASGGPQGPPPETNGGGSGNVGEVSITLSSMSKAERKAFAASGRATLRLNASAPGQLELKGSAKLGRKRGQVLAASLYVEKPGDVAVPVTLTKKARKQLRRKGALTIALTIEFGGAKPKTSNLVLKK
jgi:predicted heme/steroid binding protein